MEAVVSDILQSRKREPDGLRKTAMISLGAHVAAVAVIVLIPSVMPRAEKAPRVVMNISLGGAPGPKTGGMQMIGGRPVQAAQPSTEPQIAKTTLPPVTQTPPKMALPDPKAKPRTPPKPTVTSKDPKGTAVGRGFETQQGTAKVETGARGQGFGLSSGGLGGDGGVKLDVDFCCPEYIADMRERINRNWSQNQRIAGTVTMKFTIQRNGQITDIEVEVSSGNPVLDIAAQRSLINTRTLAPLPSGFTGRTLPVHLVFEYFR
jgi:periplasmic protein TonB